MSSSLGSRTSYKTKIPSRMSPRKWKKPWMFPSSADGCRTQPNCCPRDPPCVFLNTYALQVTSAVTINLISVSLCLHLILSTVLAPGLWMHAGYKALRLSTPFKIMHTSIRSLSHFSLVAAIAPVPAGWKLDVFSRPHYLFCHLLHKTVHYVPIYSWKYSLSTWSSYNIFHNLHPSRWDKNGTKSLHIHMQY